MSKKYTKTITREIRNSFGRFIAIIAIVALGVGFLVGILSSTPDMKATASKYYADYSMSDFDLKSTMGFTEEDINAIKNIPEVYEVMPARVTDALVSINKDAVVVGRIYGLDMDNIRINKLELVEGRMPENKTECVIEKPSTSMEQVKIGDFITVSDENEDADETYKQKKFKVVGIVDNPYYFCSNKEHASVGTGRTGVILYTWKNAYDMDAYTDIFVQTAWSGGAFSDEYDDYIESVTDKIEAVSEDRIPARHKDIIDEAMEEVDEGRATLESERADAEKEFADAEAELAQGQKEYDDGVAELEAARAEVESGQAEIDAARKTVADSRVQLEAGKAQMPAEEYNAQIAQLSATESELNKQESVLDDAREEITENKALLADAAAELAEGRKELEEGRAEANTEFADAEAELAEAEEEIKDIEEPEWYILDRNSNLSYAKFSIDVEKVAAVATVFPIFFFLVAALVSLTTMTRMVEEERIQIGTLKALGYRRRTIMSKYLIYCGVATLIGCGLGLACGIFALPNILFAIFASQYDLPPLIAEFNVNYVILACSLEILCTLGATWLSCRRTLKEKPSQLMILRAPKAGKRILLERITFLWKKLSFTHKATARNIFRYKKHLFMTVIGIAGCTALMVAGFGLKDSLTALVNTQFDELLKYDTKIELTEDKSDDVLDDFLVGKDSLYIMSSTVDVEGNKNKDQISSSLYVPKNPDGLSEFVTLRDRKSGDEVAFSDSSVLIAEKMASMLEVGVGDSITITDPDGADATFELTGIVENYAGCYVYISPDLYVAEFDKVKYNCYLLSTGVTDSSDQDKISRQLRESEYVSNVEFTSQSRETYQTILESLTLLVYVLIIFAGLLAVVVLYNLTNININERIRELATLRVLGYHHKEVAMYIFREIGILSILGTICGLILGKFLHYYVIIIAESADMMFGRDLDPSSYLLAAALTIIFSLLVDVLMLRKLRHIDMAASMKAVD